MMKKIFALLPFLLLALASCAGNGDEGLSSPVGALQTLFSRLRENNFSLAYNDRYASNENVRYQDSRYTSYSLESEGDFGFNGYAQDEGYIFSYNIVDGEVVSSAPLVNSSTGMRYQTIYDLRMGFGEFDYTLLPTAPREDGLYHYEFGVSSHNDRAIEEILLRRTYNEASHPVSLTFQVTGETFKVDAVLLEYELQDDYDSASCTVYDIGTTVNEEIKEYLDGGGTSKEPLDRDFYRLITPYLERNNFKTHLDATRYITSSEYSTFTMDQYYSDYAVVYERLDVDEGVYGQMETPSGVAVFTMEEIDSPRLDIAYSAYDEDQEFYSTLYGDYLGYYFTGLNYSDFIGYKDDDGSYYLTDSYLQTVLSYICYFQTDTQAQAIDSLRLVVDDYDEHAFTLEFNMVNRTVNMDLGTYRVSFSDPGEISFAAVEDYLSMGEDPSSQEDGTLERMLEAFRGHNYSSDVFMSGTGLAKAYYTPDYYYVELYGSPSNNTGYVKVGSSIYSFYLTYDSDGLPTDMVVSTSTDYASGDSPMLLPGCGSYFGAADDLFYFSAFDEALYDYDAYVVDSILGVEYYRNTTQGLATDVLNYFYPGQTNAYGYAMGFIVAEASSTSTSKVTMLNSYISRDGTQYGVEVTTYYDIGTTHHAYIEEQISGGLL